jgi:hypothetical protein
LEILRVPPYNFEASIQVSEENFEYEYTVQDLSDMSVTSGVATSSSSGVLAVSVPSKYDGAYLITVDSEETQVDVVRPYSLIAGETASDIADYTKNERLARAIIDSIIPEGFYYRKRVIETTGLGADYIPMWSNAKKLLKLYENNVLMFDSENTEMYAHQYGLTDDKTAIVELYSERINRLEGAANILPSGGSDLLDVKYVYKGFPRTFDYKIVVEDGYRNIPSDIKTATELLIEDIACGKMEYFKRYISDYKTDQFNLKLDGRAFEGTGNIIVDKILSKYAKSIRSVGVL